MSKGKKWLSVFAGMTITGLLAVAALVIYVDPFFQYHKPLPNFPYVLDNQLAQNPGIAKNMDYDSVLLGSSMAVYFHTEWFYETMGLETAKLVYNAAHPKDQDNILRIIDKRDQPLKRVFLGIDLNTYASGTDVVAYPIRESLYDDNLLNDVEYWWNGDVLFQYILKPLVYGYEADDFHTIYAKEYREEWFGEEQTLASYVPAEICPEEVPEDAYVEAAVLNMRTNILPYIEGNPETEFAIFFPPYSILYWEDAVRQNNLRARIKEYEVIMEELFRYDNVKIYFFADKEEIICNLDNYKDYTHYSAKVCRYMTECFAEGKELITAEDYKEVLETFMGKIRGALHDRISAFAPGILAKETFSIQ